MSVFSNSYDWKEKVLKIYHPLRLLFPVKLSGSSLSFLFGMKRSGLFWQPDGATKTDFLRAARAPPIKAICCWPKSQRNSSGVSHESKGPSFNSLIPDNPWPITQSAREHCKFEEIINNKVPAQNGRDSRGHCQQFLLVSALGPGGKMWASAHVHLTSPRETSRQTYGHFIA